MRIDLPNAFTSYTKVVEILWGCDFVINYVYNIKVSDIVVELCKSTLVVSNLFQYTNPQYTNKPYEFTKSNIGKFVCISDKKPDIFIQIEDGKAYICVKQALEKGVMEITALNNINSDNVLPTNVIAFKNLLKTGEYAVVEKNDNSVEPQTANQKAGSNTNFNYIKNGGFSEGADYLIDNNTLAVKCKNSWGYLFLNRSYNITVNSIVNIGSFNLRYSWGNIIEINLYTFYYTYPKQFYIIVDSSTDKFVLYDPYNIANGIKFYQKDSDIIIQNTTNNDVTLYINYKGILLNSNDPAIILDSIPEEATELLTNSSNSLTGLPIYNNSYSKPGWIKNNIIKDALNNSIDTHYIGFHSIPQGYYKVLTINTDRTTFFRITYRNGDSAMVFNYIIRIINNKLYIEGDSNLNFITTNLRYDSNTKSIYAHVTGTYDNICLYYEDSEISSSVMESVDSELYNSLDESIAVKYPSTLTSDYKGVVSINTDTNKLVYWNGSAWVNYDGSSTQNLISGTFSQKPTNPSIGFAYYCTDKQTTEGSRNGIMIYYAGSSTWVDALGRVIS